MTGQIIGSIVGTLIGVGLLSGASVMAKQGKLKSGQKALFFILATAIIAVGIYSLINVFK